MKTGEIWDISHIVRGRKQTLKNATLIQRDEIYRGCWIVKTGRGTRTVYNVRGIKQSNTQHMT